MARKKRPIQADFNRLQRGAERRIAGLCRRLVDGKLDAAAWSDQMVGALAERHGAAAALGRQKAGRPGPRGKEDDQLGDAVATLEAKFLYRFQQDIEGGRYTDDDGELDGDRITARAKLYARRLLGTANEAFVLATPADTLLDWHLGYTEDNCDDCPPLAENGPYRPEDLTFFPRSGDTRCLFNCKCSLVRQDGITSFLAPE